MSAAAGGPLAPAALRHDRKRQFAAIGVAVAGVLLLFVFYSLVTAAMAALVPSQPLAAVAVAQLVGLLLPGLALHARLSRSGTDAVPGRSLGLRDGLLLLGASFFGLFGVAGLSVPWVTALLATGWHWLDRLADLMATAMARLLVVQPPFGTVGMVLVLALLPAVCEELVFRGGMQRFLARHLPAWAAILVTSTCFAALHADPFGFPARLVLGGMLGIAYQRTGRLFACGLIHFLNNAAVLTRVLIHGGGIDPREAVRGLERADLLIATGLAVLLVPAAACLFALRQSTPPAPDAAPGTAPA